MTAANYPACLAVTLSYEGGYSNQIGDPGKQTDFGITQAVYDGWRRSQGFFLRPVRQIQVPEYQAIYKAQYWDAVRGDDLFAGLDLCLFDIAVNSGPLTAIKFLQQELGVAVDGHFGLLTLGALQKRNDRAAIIEAICTRRLSFWHALSTWWRFGKGWSARGAGIEAKALKMMTS